MHCIRVLAVNVIPIHGLLNHLAFITRIKERNTPPVKFMIAQVSVLLGRQRVLALEYV